MKAIIYDGIQKVKVNHVEDPKIELNDDIIIKVTSTAICGSDLHLVHGLVPNLEKGSVLGHETMGIIEEVGKDVHHLKKGAGVETTVADSLVNKAILTYVRMSFGAPANYDKLKASYDEQKAQMMMATGYTDWGDA